MIPNYITQAVLLLSYVIVFIFQYQQSKHLKSKIDTLEKFQNVFDVSKFTEYTDWLKGDYERKLEQTQIQRIDDAYMAILVDEIKKLPDDVLRRHIELFVFILHFIKGLDKNDQEIFIMKFPANEEALRQNLLRMKNKT